MKSGNSQPPVKYRKAFQRRSGVRDMGGYKGHAQKWLEPESLAETSPTLQGIAQAFAAIDRKFKASQ